MPENILVLVPHPDDEVVACAAAIGRAQSRGDKVFAFYLTHGCIAQKAMWPWTRHRYEAVIAARRWEAEEAARFLHIQPVRWSDRPARYLWREMEKAYAEIWQAITTHQINRLWVPAYEGGNPDHDALNAIAQKFKNRCAVDEFAEYNFGEGRTHSHAFPAPNGNETIIELNEAERSTKRAALAIYASEKNNLGYVQSERECYRPLVAYDYARPPHRGTLWYARFQWVPFRHPRVDFTDPADVSRAIMDFLKTN